MTGEEIMQNTCDMETYSSMLGDLGEAFNEHEIDEKTHDEAIKILHKMETHMESLYEGLGRMQFGPDPDMAYEAYREARAEEALHRGIDI